MAAKVGLKVKVQGDDIVVILANHKDVQTDCSVNATVKGKTYCFSSKDAKNQFMKHPRSNLAKAKSFYKSEQKG